MADLFYGLEGVNDDNEPLNSFYDESGYTSKSLLKNINSSLVFIWIYFSLFGFFNNLQDSRILFIEVSIYLFNR